MHHHCERGAWQRTGVDGERQSLDGAASASLSSISSPAAKTTVASGGDLTVLASADGCESRSGGPSARPRSHFIQAAQANSVALVFHMSRHAAPSRRFIGWSRAMFVLIRLKTLGLAHQDEPLPWGIVWAEDNPNIVDLNQPFINLPLGDN